MRVFTIPAIPRQQQMLIQLSRLIVLRFLYMDAPEGGWIMDIMDGVSRVPLACGLPLVTGHDVLEQYEYLGLGGSLYVVSDGDPDAVPTYENLGNGSTLYFVAP